MNETTIRSDRKKPRSVVIPTNGKHGKAKRISVDDSADSRSRLLLTAIVAFRDGDFSVRLPTDWGGTDARIAEAFNQTISQKDRISREVTRLSTTVGKEGRLRHACPFPGQSAGGPPKRIR